jgi:hypothetical protein
MQGQAQAPQLTATNLKVLVDQMNHEALATKKCEFFSPLIADQAIKGMVMSLAQHHREHYGKLFDYLNSHQ